MEGKAMATGVGLLAILVAARYTLGASGFVPVGQLLVVVAMAFALVVVPVRELRRRRDPAAGPIAFGLTATLSALLLTVFWFYGEQLTRSSEGALYVAAVALPLLALAGAWGWQPAQTHRTVSPEDDQLSAREIEEVIALGAISTVGYIAIFGAPALLVLDVNTDETMSALLFLVATSAAPFHLAVSKIPWLRKELTQHKYITLPFLWVASAGVILALLVAGAAALIGPWMLDSLTGDGESLRRTTHAAAATVGVVAALNLVGAVALAVRGRALAAVAIWAVPALCMAYPLFLADKPEPVLDAVRLYVAIVYLGELFAWHQVRSGAKADSRKSVTSFT